VGTETPRVGREVGEESGEWGIDHGSLSPTCKSICDLTVHVIHYPSSGRIRIAVGCELQVIGYTPF